MNAAGDVEAAMANIKAYYEKMYVGSPTQFTERHEALIDDVLHLECTLILPDKVIVPREQMRNEMKGLVERGVTCKLLLSNEVSEDELV
jgi:hypothetical protein